MANDTQTLKGLDDVLRKLRSLPPELVSRRGGVVRSALRKGAVVIQKEWQANIQRIVDAPNLGDWPADSTGLLKKNVVVTRDSKPGRHLAAERFVVRVRNKRYPNVTGKKPVTTAQVARLLEAGTEKRPPMPFAAPGYMSKRQVALNTVVAELNKGIARVIRKMERGA